MTATPGASKRLGTAGNSEDGQVLGPKGAHKADALTTGSRTSVSDVSADPTSPTLVTKSGDFNAGGMTMDLRGGVEVITLASFGGTDSFTITFQEADGTKVTTAAFVRGTNATAAAIQTEVRSVLTGTDLTVVTGDTDEGPFTITYNRFYQGRRFPKVIAITGTGCTGTVSRARTPAVRLGTGHLGESLFDGDGVGPGHALDGPAIGTITVTAATNEVQTLTPGAGVDGGTVKLSFRRETSGPLAWNATKATIQAEVDAMFARMGGPISAASGTDSPVVTMTGVEVATIDFGDIGAGDTCKLTYNAVEGTVAIATADLSAATKVQEAVDQLLGSSTAATVARVDGNTFTVTKNAAGSFASAFTVTSAVTFTPLGTGGYTDGGQITTDFVDASGAAVWVFTFSRGYFDGKPVRGGFRIADNSGSGSFTDGGVADTATLAVGTAGVLGSASAAYTELTTYGDSVLAVAVKDDTGVEYSNGTGGAALLDAASPVVIGSLPQGTYVLYCRTYDTESQRLGPVSSKAFTVA